MKGYVEQVIRDYPKMVRERKRLKEQLHSCQLLSADELISAMCFYHPEGERIKSSDRSDKTANVAISYRAKLDRLNEEILLSIQPRLQRLEEEISFLEFAIQNLPEELSKLMKALVLMNMTWDEVQESLYLNRRTISEKRNKAIDYLVRAYQRRESQAEMYLLS